MIIEQISVGPMENFSYLAADDGAGECVVIDPSWDMASIEIAAKNRNLKISAALFTHGHYDHCRGAKPLLKKLGISGYIEENDLSLIEDGGEMMKSFAADSKMKLAGMTIYALHTPGHTLGSVCYLIKDNLFTGDTLFIGACGRVDLPESDPKKMCKSLARLGKLPPETKIFPGHSYGPKASGTIGEQAKTNPYVKLAVNDPAGFIEAMG